jgi:hypothetical protein
MVTAEKVVVHIHTSSSAKHTTQEGTKKATTTAAAIAWGHTAPAITAAPCHCTATAKQSSKYCDDQPSPAKN